MTVRRPAPRLSIAVLLGAMLCQPVFANETNIVIGSKNFTESYLLAEIMAQTLEAEGFTVDRRFGFGGTKISFDALVAGEIDVYPEYTGTLQQVLLTANGGDSRALQATLAERGLRMLASFGFNNTYALAMDEGRAAALGISRISDLVGRRDLRAGFSHEFRNRPDGWPGLVASYGLDLESSGIEHGLAYQAIASGDIDVTDAYSTDGELTRFDMRLLVDDRGFFPRYLGVPLARVDLDTRAVAALGRLSDSLTDSAMRDWNARIVVDGADIEQAAAEFLATIDSRHTAQPDRNDTTSRLVRNTRRHLELTFAALAAACVVAILIAMLVHRSAPLSRAVIYVAGLFQTIPSIALLALMIPLLGVGVVPAIVALFLYSLLPILRNAITALTTVDPVCQEVAEAMGMTRREQLRYVLIPMSAPHIIAGIRTAAVVSIGTATLAAFIGAGGLGEPIVTGLALNDTSLILQGAIPAALLAILTELAFSSVERWLIPEHLRAT